MNETRIGAGQNDGMAGESASSLDDEAYEWVQRFTDGRGRRSDMAALKQWMARSAAHAEAFDRVSRTWTSLEPVGHRLAARGVVTRRSDAPGATRMGRRAFIGGALAASAAGAAVMAAYPPLDLWPPLSALAADVRTDPGQQRQIMLPDQVSIDLNTRSSLAMLPAGAGEARLISGEALISSPPQMKAPFTLLAADGRIVFTDARFNVRIDGHAVCVTCVDGAGRVEQGTSTASLSAGGQVLYSSQGIGPVARIDPAVVSAWHDGIVIFESTPVVDVIAEVNRYRPGKVILTNKALGRRLFDARLRIENIGHVVRQIELAFGAHATELPAGIVLLG